MSRPPKPWLDWRRERDIIAKPLASRGGVIRVQASPAGPLMEFANAFRSHLDHGAWEYPWVTIQFDPDNSNTRYFGEMTRQIERSISLDPDAVPPISLGDGSKVGADLAATEITITNSFNFGSGEYEQAVVHERRAQRIIEAIKGRVARESFCFMFVNSERFPRQDLAHFQDLLWRKGLGALPAGGVLLVDLTRSGPRTDIEWPPDPAVGVRLADEYDPPAREDAITDLAAFLLESALETAASDARAYARAMLDSHAGPATLYSQLAAICAARSRTR